MTIPAFVTEHIARIGVRLDEDELPRLARYLDMLLEANEQFNLTGIRDRDEAWSRHIVDSLTALPGLEHLPDGGTVIDVGAGGGLPGIPLAIVRPTLSFTLLEATGKKANFLRTCAEQLPLPNVRVVQDRAESVGQDREHRQQYDVAVCRAIGPMRELLEYAMPLVKVGGYLLAMKGPKAEAELHDAANALDVLGAGKLSVFDAYPEEFGQNLVIVSVAKERTTPRTYPRRPGIPRQSPL